ncbi:MAG: 1-(5-phosphoribosyl)-5-[(5-phosphoribosylamino)methylideneamino]imidazole-4-carboxamide isomerase [Candidatus Izemoplasma sp.]|nr:1-(5-phosphoribosyl)-5-[(5-phosphoribosylamino)methylideneamino]imidazole-4-carboxamide isomerase [Candidatus Izemoplasma sp.]
MIIFPAIDLMGGNVVRLQQGDFKEKTIYSSKPVEIAKAYEKAGATWLHVIDLDGAKTGSQKNDAVVKTIIANTSLKLQVGGGIRSVKRIETLLNMGVNRVILGTFAIKEMALLPSLTKRFSDQIIVSIDAKDGYVTYHGWQETSAKRTIDFCQDLSQAGIKTIVYTDIAKDGMMAGPNFNDYQILSEKTNLNVIASGGVSTYNDVIKLSQMDLYGAIIGKALYTEDISIKEAILCSQDASSPV